MTIPSQQPHAEEPSEVDMGVVTRDLVHAARILAAIPWLHDDAPDPSDEQPSLVRAAYHEAGHAVVARALGIEVASASVRAQGSA